MVIGDGGTGKSVLTKQLLAEIAQMEATVLQDALGNLEFTCRLLHVTQTIFKLARPAGKGSECWQFFL